MPPTDIRRLMKPGIPDGWQLVLGTDTGTYMSTLLSMVCPDPYAVLFIYEFPNYRYTQAEIELQIGAPYTPNREWAGWILDTYNYFVPHTTSVKSWADPNSQFKHDLSAYGIHLMPNGRQLDFRVEVTREYFQAQNPPRVYLAPWLEVLPFELEHAEFPPEETHSGSFHRIKQKDHTLDCAEHILSRRPRGRAVKAPKSETFLQRFAREHNIRPQRRFDPHLGGL